MQQQQWFENGRAKSLLYLPLTCNADVQLHLRFKHRELYSCLCCCLLGMTSRTLDENEYSIYPQQRVRITPNTTMLHLVATFILGRPLSYRGLLDWKLSADRGNSGQLFKVGSAYDGGWNFQRHFWTVPWCWILSCWVLYMHLKLILGVTLGASLKLILFRKQWTLSGFALHWWLYIPSSIHSWLDFVYRTGYYLFNHLKAICTMKKERHHQSPTSEVTFPELLTRRASKQLVTVEWAHTIKIHGKAYDLFGCMHVHHLLQESRSVHLSGPSVHNSPSNFPRFM